jgi:phospholipid transport system substrate-binding protein
MPFAAMGRRRWLQASLATVGLLVGLRELRAEPEAIAPIQQLDTALLQIMRAGQATPFGQRFETLGPVIDSVFDLSAILQVSVGLTWSSLPQDQQGALMVAFRRYTIANYVSNFDSYSGQRLDVLPDTRNLPNGEMLVQTRLVSTSGETHQLDYVMRQTGGGWKAVDVLADGSISRVAVQRSDFRHLLASGGASALIQSLNRKTSDLSGGALT